MATSYTGLRVQDTYNAIIKIGDNSNLTGTPKLLSDGLGNDSPLYLSGTRLGIGISPAYQFHTSGNAKIGGDVIISGDLTVNGDLTYLNVTDLQVEDPLIKLAKDNTSNTLDIGFFGKYVESATTKYTGLFWDASTDKFRLYEGLQVEPTTTVDVTGTGYTRSLLNADLEGNVTGTVSSLSNHDTNDLVEGSFNLYFTTARARASFSAGTGVTITDGEIAIGQDVATDSNVNFNRITSSEDIRFDGTNTRLRSDSEFDFLTISGQAQSLRTKGVSAQTTYSGNSASSGMFNALNGYAVGTGSGTTVIDSSRNLTNIDTGNFSGQVTIPETPTADAHAASKKYVDDATGNIDVAKRLEIDVKNVSGGSLAKGTIVHAEPTGTLTGNVIEVVAADANVAANMPAIGVLNEALVDDEEGKAVMFGTVQGIDTLSFSVGDELYVSETAGEFTATKPTGFTSQVQKIAIVVKSHASNGLIKVFGAGRSNDIPNRVDRDMNFTDDSKLKFGTDSDLELWFSSADGYLRNNTGDLYIQNLANDKSIVFQSDNGIGGVTEYLKIDGNINRNVILVTTQLNDNVPLIFGSGAGRPSIKYDSTASQLFINGDTKFLSDAYVVNNLNVQKSVYQTATGGFYISKPYGGDFYTTTNNYTGAIEIALPTGGTGHDDMIKFVVDIFDYRTQESVTVFVGGYTYENVGSGNTTWYYVSATVLGQSANQNYTVRFGDNGTEHCVWIGDTDSTWNHLQVIVRDFFAGYTADINNYLGAWDINVVTTQTTVNNTLTNCFPMSSDTIADYLPLTGGTLTGNLNGTSAHFTGNVEVGDGTNISMDASANGQLMIDGNGYQGAIALDDQAMHIYHNSSSRSLVLGTNETARLTIDGGGSASTFSTTYLTVGGEGYIRSDDSGYLHFQGGSTGTRFYNNSNNVAHFTILDNGTATFSGNVTTASLSAASIGVSGTNGTDGKGISLYGGASSGEPTYGMMFMETATYGTFGYVTGSYATYFTMNSSSNRGWIFRNVGVGNVASINNLGHAHFQTPTKITSNDTSLTFEDAGTNAVIMKVGAGDELYIGGNNTWQFLGTTTGQAKLNSSGYVSVTAGASNYTGFDMFQADGSRVGYIYGDSGETSNPGIGILDSDGNWALRIRRDISVELRVNNIIKLSTGINSSYFTTNLGIGATPSNSNKLHIQQAKSGSSAENYDLLRFNLTGTGAIGDSSSIVWYSTSGTKTAGIQGISGQDNILYGELAFNVRKYTTDSFDEALRINNRGNIGVNQASPLQKLEIQTGTDTDGIIITGDGSSMSTGQYRRIGFRYSNTDSSYSSEIRFTVPVGGVHGGAIAFNTHQSGSPTMVERGRFNQYGQLLINATSSGYGSNLYGYNLGVRGNSSQAFISIARDTQTLDTQGVIIGLDTNHSYFINREAKPIELITNNTVRMHLHGSENRVGIGADPVSSAGVNNFLMVKGSQHSGIVLVDTDGGAVHEMWNDGGILTMWDSSIGYRMRFYTNGDAQGYNNWTFTTIGIGQSGGTTGQGISLYGGASAGQPTYGMMFMQTGTFGTYGSVSGSWATYFTMNDDPTRGWIFRRVGSGNYASISGGGDLSLSGIINFPTTNMRLLGSSSSYLRIKSGSASDSGIELQDTSGNILGYFYGNTSQMGMFNKEGYDLFKATPGGSGITTIYKGNGITKIEAGDNVNIYHSTDITQFNSNGYIYTQSWIKLGGGGGIFSDTSSAHIYPNSVLTYGTWRTAGSRNGYSGIYDNHSGTNVNMMDSGGNGGNWHSSAGWHFYYNRTNACLAVGSSTTSSSYSLYVTGSIYSTADVIAYSDKRAKENIVTVDSAIEKVNKLRGVYYTPKEGEDKSRKVGVIAQEILEVLPEVVTHDKENDRYGVDYGKITGLLIEAIKDQQKQIDKLTKFVDKLNK